MPAGSQASANDRRPASSGQPPDLAALPRVPGVATSPGPDGTECVGDAGKQLIPVGSGSSDGPVRDGRHKALPRTLPFGLYASKVSLNCHVSDCAVSGCGSLGLLIYVPYQHLIARTSPS